MNVVMTDNFDIKNWANLCVLVVRDCVYSLHDAIKFPNPSSTSSPIL